jgi:hypothetical protein
MELPMYDMLIASKPSMVSIGWRPVEGVVCFHAAATTINW